MLDTMATEKSLLSRVLLQQQKVLLYLISEMVLDEIEYNHYSFSIPDFCKFCGIDSNSGKNHQSVKKSVEALVNEGILGISDGETKFSSESKIEIGEASLPRFLETSRLFSKDEILIALAMKSRYSIRLYELLKSYKHEQRKEFGIEDLKWIMSAESYTRFADFKIHVLESAVQEINELSDINVSVTGMKKGRKFQKIIFSISQKTPKGKGLKPEPKERLIQCNYQVFHRQAKAIRVIAAERDLQISAVVREALDCYLRA